MPDWLTIKKLDMQQIQNQRGFTLVELAIVLMIIGLLIGGVLRGQELLDNARIGATIQQIKAYQGAKTTFQDEYSALPGDMPNATDRLPGCTAAASSCGNGNGDGVIGHVIPSTSGYDSAQAGNGALPQVETSYFWKHLALAHLISGVVPTADVLKPDWGQTHPASKFNGGFTVFFSISAGDWGTGTILKLQSGPNSDGGQGQAPISPIKGRQLDQKMDDGLPNTGKVTSDYDGWNCKSGALNGDYVQTEELNCVMYFNID
jgi:prepilin-type N-terminal cleavage/methylation domain-containing protein